MRLTRAQVERRCAICGLRIAAGTLHRLYVERSAERCACNRCASRNQTAPPRKRRVHWLWWLAIANGLLLASACLSGCALVPPKAPPKARVIRVWKGPIVLVGETDPLVGIARRGSLEF